MTEVLLVGYQDQGNLGMGYLASVLDEHGHSVEMIDVRDGPEADRGAAAGDAAAGGRVLADLPVLPAPVP